MDNKQTYVLESNKIPNPDALGLIPVVYPEDDDAES